MKPNRLRTTVSTKGQVILPKQIRELCKWDAGTELVVEKTPEGVLLKEDTPLSPTRYEDVRGSLRYQGKPKTIEEMNEAIAIEVRRRHASGRY